MPLVAYHAIRTFDARVTVAAALIKRFCGKAKYTEWEALWGKVRKRQRIRNSVAHGMATIFGNPPNRKWGIGASPYDLDDFVASSNSNDYYSSKEILEAVEGIMELVKELDAFRASLEADVALQLRLSSNQSNTHENNRKSKVVAHTQSLTGRSTRTSLLRKPAG